MRPEARRIGRLVVFMRSTGKQAGAVPHPSEIERKKDLQLLKNFLNRFWRKILILRVQQHTTFNSHLHSNIFIDVVDILETCLLFQTQSPAHPHLDQPDRYVHHGHVPTSRTLVPVSCVLGYCLDQNLQFVLLP